MASYQPTLAIAQRDRAVRVLGYQGLIQPVSNVQPLLALTFSIDVKYVRHSFAPSETRKSVAPGLFQRFMDSGLKSQQCDRRDTARHNLRELGKSVLTGHKKEPRSTNARGCYRLLPQLVGSCVRAAIFVGGWGSSPGWPTNQNDRHDFNQHNVAPPAALHHSRQPQTAQTCAPQGRLFGGRSLTYPIT